jgi:hypothetical protein
VVAIAAAAVCIVLETDNATTHPSITMEQVLLNASALESVRQDGTDVTVRFAEDFDTQTAFGDASHVYDTTVGEDVNIEDVLRFANVPIGEGGVQVTVE